jgi:hypothetical protein
MVCVCVCVCANSEEMEVVPQVLQALLVLPANMHVAVRFTSIQLVGELSEWIEKHSDTLGKFDYICMFVYVSSSLCISVIQLRHSKWPALLWSLLLMMLL